MKIIKTYIKDLLVVKQKNNFDRRGSLREIFNKKVLNKKFVFEYCTTSKKDALRGFHFQHKFQQGKFVNGVDVNFGADMFSRITIGSFSPGFEQHIFSFQ